MELLTRFEPNKEGVFIGVDADTYHSAPGESNSSLSAMSRSPLDYFRYRDGQVPREVTEYMEYGQLFHSAVLEGGDISKLCYIQPELYADGSKPWHNGARECKQWNEMHADRPVLSRRDFVQLKLEVDYVTKHPKVSAILRNGHAEVSIFARCPRTGLLLKGRLDYLRVADGMATITDVKTTQDASTNGFAREILSRKYHVQAAHYRRLVNLTDPSLQTTFCFIPIEKGKLIKVNPRFLARQAMDLGDGVIDANLDKLVQCRRTGVWPEWHDETDSVEFIDLPDFCYENQQLTGMTNGS